MVTPCNNKCYLQLMLTLDSGPSLARGSNLSPPGMARLRALVVLFIFSTIKHVLKLTLPDDLM